MATITPTLVSDEFTPGGRVQVYTVSLTSGTNSLTDTSAFVDVRGARTIYCRAQELDSVTALTIQGHCSTAADGSNSQYIPTPTGIAANGTEAYGYAAFGIGVEWWRPNLTSITSSPGGYAVFRIIVTF